MKKQFLLLLALVLLGLPGLAQMQESTGAEEPEVLPKYRIRSTVVGVPTMRDRFLSPLKFSGILFGRNIGTIRYYPKGIRQHNFLSVNGLMLNGVNQAMVPFLNLGFDYTYHHRLLKSQDQRLKLYGGGGLNSMFALKFHNGNVNNVLAYDIALALDVSGLASYSFTLFRRQFVLTEQLSLPVGGLVARPNYIWATPYFLWEDEGRLGEAVEASSWGNFGRIQNKLSLDYQTTRRRKGVAVGTNYWRLTYVWDYYQMNRPNQVKAAQQTFMLGRVIGI